MEEGWYENAALFRRATGLQRASLQLCLLLPTSIAYESLAPATLCRRGVGFIIYLRGL